MSTPAYGAGELFCMAKVLHYKSLDLDTHWVANQLRFAHDIQPSPFSVSHALPVGVRENLLMRSVLQSRVQSMVQSPVFVPTQTK